MKLPLIAAACLVLTASSAHAQRRINTLPEFDDVPAVDYSASTKKPLLIWAGIGVGLAVIGAVPIGASGANPYSLVGAPLIVGGLGMATQSGLTSLVRLFDERLVGTPRLRAPWSLEVGAAWVHDAYRDRMLTLAQGRATQGPLEVIATGYRSYDGHYNAGDLGARVRLASSRRCCNRCYNFRCDELANSDFLEVRATGRLRDDDDDNVKVATVEGEIAARIGMEHLAPPLRGMFGELALGGGLERAAFKNGHEIGGLMLGRFAWGMYLGRGNELQLFYDHRRDSLAGGIAAGRAAGFVGSVGAIVDYRVIGPWAVHAELEIGSAWVSTLGVRYEGGAR